MLGMLSYKFYRIKLLATIEKELKIFRMFYINKFFWVYE